MQPDYDLNKGWDSLAADLLYACMNTPPNESVFSGNPEEIAFFERRIRSNGGRALDQACGTGRHLFPLLRRGLEVHGADASKDALEYAMKIRNETGLETKLYHQRMEDLDVPDKYGTIYIANGTFSAVHDRQDALQTLRRLRQHLVPGGQLLMETFLPEEAKGIRKYDVNQKAVLWGPKKRKSGEGEISTKLWTESIDPLEQTMIEKRRYDLHIDGKMVRSEEHTLTIRWYYKWELMMMLETTGFDDIFLYSDYSDRPATKESKIIVWGARHKGPWDNEPGKERKNG